MYILKPVVDLSFSELLNSFIEFVSYPPILIPLIILGIVGIAGQWSLYAKCDLNGVACIVPVWNVLEFMKIMGRPAAHGIIVMLPPPLVLYLIFVGPLGQTANIALAALFALVWLIFMAKIYIELCQSFGITSTKSYVLCILLNGFYVLYLGISENTEYQGPVFGKKGAAKQNE